MSGLLHTPTSLTQGKEPSVPTAQETEWAPEVVWIQWQWEKNPCPCQESNLGCPVHSLVIINSDIPPPWIIQYKQKTRKPKN